MNHPNGPHGQGFPGQQPPYGQQWGQPQQPAFPQQPYQPVPQPYGAPVPPYGAPVPPYGAPPPQGPTAPNGATAIIAGVLAGLGGAVNIVGGGFMAIGLALISSDSTLDTGSGGWGALVAVAMLNIVAGVVLSVGTVLLFLRKPVSRWIVAAGCGVSILSSLISLGITSTLAGYAYRGSGTEVLGLIFPVATLVLVLVPPTAAWINAKRPSSPPPYSAPPQHFPPYGA